MYRFLSMKAVGVAGFRAGLSRKAFEIDLSEFIESGIDCVCIFGANGSGKSTFLSLIHPAVWPVNGKRKFIVPGKEGLLIRKYIDTDGTIITSKCIYKPKKDGGHTPSCFFEVEKPGCEPVEMNPNGNVASYEELLYQYFGITKDFLTYATYSNDVANIVRMNDTDRKNSIGTLVPNTKRFEVGFNLISDKYRDLRNMIRNLSQKIVSLRDEDSLVSDLKRLTHELQDLTNDREDRIRKLSTMEGRLKELTRGEDVDKMMSEYHLMVASNASGLKEFLNLVCEIRKLYHRLGIVPNNPDGIAAPDIDKIPSIILEYERKLLLCQSRYQQYNDTSRKLQTQLSDLDQELMEIDASLYSIQMQNIDELKATRDEYQTRLNEMRYTKNPDQYADMTYDEIVAFSKTVIMVEQMIQALYDEYGQLVEEYFKAADWHEFVAGSVAKQEKLQATILTKTSKKDQIYRKLIENNQYLQIASVLDKRPPSCTIDSCPFIAQALKYKNVASDILALTQQYKEIALELTEAANESAEMDKRVAINTDATHLIQYVEANFHLFAKYLGIKSTSEIYKAFADGTWDQIFDMVRLKDLTAILSEKSLYLEILNIRIPEVEHAIEMAKAYGTNRDILLSQSKQKHELRDMIVQQLDECDMHIGIHHKQQNRYAHQLDLWKELNELINRYRKFAEERVANEERIKSQQDRITKINELVDKCKEEERKIQNLDAMIQEIHPTRERVKLGLDEVRRLKISQLEVERNFTVIDVIRTIMSPGKGIRKELINLYMYEIYQIANQLLLSTFDGKLYLKEFLITDKEFIIPYVYNGTESPDISFASSAQQATITSAISLAILSKLVNKYGVYTPDELDGPMSPTTRDSFIEVTLKQMKYVGIIQVILITQDPSRYCNIPNVGFIKFPGGEELNSKGLDIIEV